MTDPDQDGRPDSTPPTYPQHDAAAADQSARSRRRRRRVGLAVAGAGAVTAGALATAAALGAFSSASTPRIAVADQGGAASGWGSGQTDPFGSGSPGSSGNDGFGFGNGSGSGSGGTSAASASAAQQVGVVDINTVLGYQSAAAAGTGLVLSSDGEILTNNHVVDGATKITVTVVSTGRSYAAAVVGTDATDDVAVLKLQNASGLTTAPTAASANVQVGDRVTGVGNAGGAGGTPSAAAGTVTALNQTITASDVGGGNAETLNGMIETDADIQAGDSGGPLFDQSNHVIGMDSAASSGGDSTSGYAIPINQALTIARHIENGQSSSTIHIGDTPFLGIELATSGAAYGALGDPGQSPMTAGVAIAGVVSSSPADQAGLAAGDTITSLDQTSIDSASALSNAIAQHQVGDHVTVGWTDNSGQSHTTTLTLIAGPAA